jgi:membrane-associated phospholipid phosphatase
VRVGWDRTLFWQVNHLAAATGWAHSVVAAYALWGGLVAEVVVWLGCWWWSARRRQDGGRAVAAVLLTGAASVLALVLGSQLISPAVARPRPFVAMPHVLLLLSHSADGSLPSDHCLIAGAFAAGLLMVDRRWGLVATVLALALAFARVYCGVHYPADVLAGLLIGAAVAVLLVLALRRPVARALRPLAGTPLRPLLAAPAPLGAPEPVPPEPR